jgi:type II secretory pathway pseudopilin PulG
MLFKIKKAAMFGLDARIALSIFGALSVISGAALYSAIQEAKVTSIITEMNELGKAVDAYQLDVGTLPLFDTTTPQHMDASKLISDTVYNWNGPYISGVVYTNPLNIKHNVYDYTGVRRMETSAWGNTTTQNCTSSSTSCAIFILLGAIPKPLADAIDLKIDGGLDMENGNIRLLKSDSNDTWFVWLNYRPYIYH